MFSRSIHFCNMSEFLSFWRLNNILYVYVCVLSCIFYSPERKYIHIPCFVYPFTCLWTFGLFPSSDYCGSSCCSLVFTCLFESLLSHISRSGYIPRSGIIGSYHNSMFNVLRDCFPTVAAPFYMPTSNTQRFQFPHIFVSSC